jgi:phosphatidylserine/phosphatidylglycerophosphate/cardiolipin synthase-like enzyme
MFRRLSALLAGAAALALNAAAPEYAVHYSVRSTTDGRFAAYENAAPGRPDLDLVNWIGQATTTVDAAVYNLTLANVADALVAAKGRGVRVRFITEHDNIAAPTTAPQLQKLTDAGIPWIDDTFSGTAGSNLMHHKFLVLDAGVAGSPVRDLTLTGSFNWTTQAAFYNAENLVALRDAAAAQLYLAEFNTMWGSATATPSASASRFSTAKPSDVPHLIHPGCPASSATIVFGPQANLRQALLDAIATADYEIDFSIDQMTDDAVQQAMLNRRSAVPGLIVRGVFESDTATAAAGEYPAMNGDPVAGAWSPRADVLKDAVSSAGQLHHKYLLIDAAHENSDPILITGSPNWTLSGLTRNDEDFIVFHDARLANDFLQEFAARYSEAGGTAMAAPAAGAFAAARPPYFPCGLESAAATGSTGSVQLGWSAALDLNNPVSYQVFDAAISGGENFLTPLATVLAPSYLATGLANGAPRYFVVRSADGGGMADGNVIELGATPADTIAPAAPRLSLSKPVTAGSLTFSWTAVSADASGGAENLQGYELYQSATPSFPGAPVASYVPATLSTTRSVPAATTCFTLRARDTAGNLSQ